ncbi:Mpo1-like protein [Mycobacterium sp. NPDC048908]|uniref:Mpo1-like protein n=1 Tax=Mycobacterium sp. NPDC048908 TaxID=3364292 RepID=UPI003713F639
MGASWEEFAAGHRTQHLTAFNRWCAVVGNFLAPVAAVAVLTGRPRVGLTVFALGNATLLAGHAAEGNLPRAVRDLIRHPVWSARADAAVATATVRSALGSS